MREFVFTHKIKYISGRAPRAIMHFSDVPFPKFIERQIQASGFVDPTPIQCAGWPILLSGSSMIGIAKTGSGKTITFMIPGIIHLLDQRPVQRNEGPIVLVMGPTRELVIQIYEQTRKFSEGSGVRVACLYGGAEKYQQKRSLYAGPQIVVATPGRLLDFLESGVTNLNRVTYLVLDEADRMLDMGFEPQIRRVVGFIHGKRQTVMCSATWPREVQKLAKEIFQEQAIYIQIGDSELNANEKIKQEVLVMEEGDKHRELRKLFESFKGDFSALVFTKTKKGCEWLSKDIRNWGFFSMCIHGDKAQEEREFVLDTFKRKKINILVATDVAARGLDIDNITYVINFDFPMQIEDYVHRIGRTGRAGLTGHAISFFTSENCQFAKPLIKVKQ